jgi:hypothetical protein
MKMILTVILIIILAFTGCRKKNDLPQILNDLRSTNDSVRFKAIEELEKAALNIEEQIQILNEAKTEFPPANYEWQSIPSILIGAATKQPHIELVKIVKDNFTQYDRYAKNEVLVFLANFDNAESAKAFTSLATKYPEEINYLPTGMLSRNFKYKDILFPTLLELINQETTDADVLLLLLEYLNAKQLEPENFTTYLPRLLSLSEKYRVIIEEKNKSNVDIWDGDYQLIRYKAGIIADLLGHFENEKVITELKNYLLLKDNRLVMFGIVSLMKQDIMTNIETINRVASDSECRNWLYNSFVDLNKEKLFPEKYKTQKAFAESDMVSWLTYPTELARIPDSVELMKVIEVDTKSKDGIVEFYLFRFKSDHEDWKDKGWLTGVSGYFPIKDKPSTDAYGYTFSSFEKWDKLTSDEHVNKILELIDDASRNLK